MLLCLASLRDWVRFTNRLRNIEHIVLLQSILPFSAPGGTLLFYLPSMLSERTRVVISTNVSFWSNLVMAPDWGLIQVSPMYHLPPYRARSNVCR